jgi:glycosyltransferase involved in cell wall biosynthesis
VSDASRPVTAICSLIAWRSLFQRPQQIATHWPEPGQVVFLEPLVLRPGNAWWAVREPYGWRLSVPLLPHSARNWLVRAVVRAVGAVVPLRWLWERLAALWLALAWRWSGLPSVDRLLVQSPQYLPLLRCFPGARLVFDYMDDLFEFTGTPGYFRDYLRELLERCHAVAATSEPLAEKLRALGQDRVEVVGNGVDAGHFYRRGPEEVPGELRALPGRKLVYAGSLAYWVDFGLLEEVARVFPEDTLVLAGPVYPEVRAAFERLCARPNVHYPGVLPYEELPRWLSGCAVGLIPFLYNELTVAVNPNKAYEYAAVGLPFVARDLPPLEPFRGLVPLTRTNEAFLDGVRQCLERGSDSAGLRALAGKHAWAAKAKALYGLFG